MIVVAIVLLQNGDCTCEDSEPTSPRNHIKDCVSRGSRASGGSTFANIVVPIAFFSQHLCDILGKPGVRLDGLKSVNPSHQAGGNCISRGSRVRWVISLMTYSIGSVTSEDENDPPLLP